MLLNLKRKFNFFLSLSLSLWQSILRLLCVGGLKHANAFGLYFSYSYVDVLLSRDFPPSHSSPPVPSSPNRMTPVPLLDKDYVRMLKEAAREQSARSSAR